MGGSINHEKLLPIHGRNGKSIKMLAYDERGLVLVTRRLRDGCFAKIQAVLVTRRLRDGCFAKIQAIAGDPDRVLTASMVLSYFAEGKVDDDETFYHQLVKDIDAGG